MGDVGAPLEYYSRTLGHFIGYWHMLAIFSILSGIFLLFLAYLILKEFWQSKTPIYGFDAGHRSITLFHLNVVLGLCLA